MKDDCIFCKISEGELPSTRVYEDDEVVAFLDIGPLIKGHTLVIPRAHSETILDTPDETLAKLMAVAKRIGGAQMDALGAEGFNVTQANGACAGQVVPHIHFHVVPRYADDGHHWNWNAKKYESADEMSALGQKLSAALDSRG